MNKTQANNLQNWLALNRLHGLSADDIVCISENFDDLSRPLRLQKLGVSDRIIKQIRNLGWDAIEKELAWAEKQNHHIVTLNDERYPAKLHEISAAPLLLFVKGNVDLLNQPQLAMVGSRNPTPIGEETAEQFAMYLSSNGLVITSGLALGVDAASHKGALRAGPTVAVMGTGINHIYPTRHVVLAEAIIEQGALVSEFSLNTPPKRENFPRRNRIISGLSVGTLVVEAALRSGSLITARFAGEQGREVFAIPGSIHNPLSRGCHKLLREGAKLVEKASDILEELQWTVTAKVEKSSKSVKNLDSFQLGDEDTKLLMNVGFETTAIDAMIHRTGFSAATVSSILLMLELHGYVKSVAGGYCRIK